MGMIGDDDPSLRPPVRTRAGAVTAFGTRLLVSLRTRLRKLLRKLWYMTVVAARHPSTGTLLHNLGASARQAYAWSLDTWVRRMNPGTRSLAPAFGLVQDRLSARDLAAAVPDHYPESALPDKGLPVDFGGSGEEYGRAAAWAFVLSEHVNHNKDQFPRGTILTSIGLVRFRDGIRLAVVHYLASTALLRPTNLRSVELYGWSFPVVARPWLPSRHIGSKTGDGHCWVRYFGTDQIGRYGVLTAGHVIPPNTELGEAVTIETSRCLLKGFLRRRSDKMDAALIEVDGASASDLYGVEASRVVGYKPVRFLPGYNRDKLEGDVTGFLGFAGPAYFRQDNGEPLQGAYMTMNRFLQPGDSGCLIIDIEPERYGSTAAPYMIYLGANNLGRGREGYGLFLAQAVDQWNLTTCFAEREEAR